MQRINSHPWREREKAKLVKHFNLWVQHTKSVGACKSKCLEICTSQKCQSSIKSHPFDFEVNERRKKMTTKLKMHQKPNKKIKFVWNTNQKLRKSLRDYAKSTEWFNWIKLLSTKWLATFFRMVVWYILCAETRARERESEKKTWFLKFPRCLWFTFRKSAHLIKSVIKKKCLNKLHQRKHFCYSDNMLRVGEAVAYSN